MDFWGKAIERRETVRHGGCVLLRATCRRPQAENPATAHFDAMAQALAEHVRQAYLPNAARELEAAAAAGVAHRHRPLLLQSEMKADKAGSGAVAQMRFSLTLGEQVLLFHELQTFWSTDGTLQFPRPVRLARRRREAKRGDS